jgi:hypothetical protein
VVPRSDARGDGASLQRTASARRSIVIVTIWVFATGMTAIPPPSDQQAAVLFAVLGVGLGVAVQVSRQVTEPAVHRRAASRPCVLTLDPAHRIYGRSRRPVLPNPAPGCARWGVKDWLPAQVANNDAHAASPSGWLQKLARLRRQPVSVELGFMQPGIARA